MRSHKLETVLTEFIEAAAEHLHAEVARGAEVSFELATKGGRRGSRAQATLYCYRALTGAFIAERQADLERLSSHAEAAALLASFDGLDRYLAGAGIDVGAAKGRARVRAAIATLLADVFHEQTDFELHPERLHAALDRLERSVLASTSEALLVATLHGLTIASPEMKLTQGLTIAHPDTLRGAPEGAVVAQGDAPGEHLLVIFAADHPDPQEAIASGRAVLQDLLRALRLFGDGRVTLGTLAWARVGAGTWNPLALGTGGRPHGMLVVTAEQEDELRAFCNLVSRRAPHGNELAWALRRFELGCERESPYEALSDHLLALRTLLEPEGPSSGLLAERLAALCATPEHRVELTERTLQALALERVAIAGTAVKRARDLELASEVADHLRALLRDVICGHLAPQLADLADELLNMGTPVQESALHLQESALPEASQESAPHWQESAPPEDSEEITRHAGEPGEILDVLVQMGHE
jgi:hypothetical protein